jgi:hypothetical protein
MSDTDILDLGTYTEGSIPPPLVVTFDDENGNPLDLSAFTVGKFEVRRYGQAAVEKAASVSSATSGPTVGQVTYTWVSGDMAAGTWTGEMWAVNGTTNRYVSRKLRWFVQPAVLVPA